MSYLYTTLTPEATYTYINQMQVYNTIATELAAHSAWELVESVDSTRTASYKCRRFVWKNKSSVSGLAADYYVIFDVFAQDTTGTKWDETVYNQEYLRVYLAENYDSGTNVASNLAMAYTNGSRTLDADGKCTDITWDLDSASNPSNSYFAYGSPFQGNTTSLALVISVTNTGMMLARGNLPLYIGAIDSALASEDDPFAVAIAQSPTTGANNFAASSAHFGASFTRHPGLSAGSYTYVFGHTTNYNGNSSGGNIAAGRELRSSYDPNYGGQMGNASGTDVGLWGTNPIASRCMLWTANYSSATNSTRGGFRGWFKDLRGGNLVSHSFGDQFKIDGATYVALGNDDNSGLWPVAA